jgi:hypothetical protein
LAKKITPSGRAALPFEEAAMWTTLQIIVCALGILLIFGGEKLSMPILGSAGLVFLGLTAVAIGWETIITRQIKFGQRRHGNVETFTGLAAILQGVQFNLIGLFLIGIAIAVQLNADGRAVFLQMVRRPGLSLIVFGALCLIQAVITLTGSHELRQGPRWMVSLNLAISRLLPGIILVVIGLGALGLGGFEIIAPAAFDEMGGGILETIYGLK